VNEVIEVPETGGHRQVNGFPVFTSKAELIQELALIRHTRQLSQDFLVRLGNTDLSLLPDPTARIAGTPGGTP
jgi:hypothetical protein